MAQCITFEFEAFSETVNIYHVVFWFYQCLPYIFLTSSLKSVCIKFVLHSRYKKSNSVPYHVKIFSNSNSV